MNIDNLNQLIKMLLSYEYTHIESSAESIQRALSQQDRVVALFLDLIAYFFETFEHE